MRSTATRLKIGFLLAIAIMVMNILVPVFSGRWIDQLRLERQAQEQLRQEVQLMLLALKDSQSSQRGFILTGREDYLSPLYQGFAEIDRLMPILAVKAGSDADLGATLKNIRPLLIELREFYNETIEVRRQQGLLVAADRVAKGKGKQIKDSIRNALNEFQILLNQRIVLLEREIHWREDMGTIGLSLTALLDLMVLGMLFFFTFRVLRESRESAQNLHSLSEQLSSGVQKLELRNREISLLSNMAGALHSTSLFDECFGIISRFAQQLFPQNAGCLALYHPSRDVLEETGRWGDWEPGNELFEPQQCWAIRRGQSHRVRDVSQDLICPHLDGHPGLGHGYLCVPLMAHGEPLGVVTLLGQGVDIELAEAFAEQVSLGVANLSLRDSLRQQSVIDALTGLHNRRFLDETLRRELLRASRKQTPIAVVLLDVDHFKRFNDTFGHEAGDLVLRHLAQEMRRHVRASDLACRYGGEEFALIMPEITLEDAISRCEALRLAVTRLQVRYGGQPLGPISISLGLALFPQDGQQAEILLHAADSALYEAKRGGRNRLCLYHPPRASDLPVLE
ncbi:hypothetical protein BZL41_13175 [Pseudomonas sp. PIC25]|uniref:sensor domain-containing diguanylate cyclase n=1 Tax=Pseudomonas sp. PIC25 TaxID=1958773 RepID=UPI000BD255D8|nr:diguanylate cyclase [Pseudomonas sp. PIC25]PAU62829.1 hypothetical protein BZL41_13175 [Pseudomonas sp. PIC25]